MFFHSSFTYKNVDEQFELPVWLYATRINPFCANSSLHMRVCTVPAGVRRCRTWEQGRRCSRAQRRWRRPRSPEPTEWTETLACDRGDPTTTWKLSPRISHQWLGSSETSLWGIHDHRPGPTETVKHKQQLTRLISSVRWIVYFRPQIQQTAVAYVFRIPTSYYM